MKVDYRDLLGKDFEYGGRGPDTFDCFGIVKELARRTGVDLPEYGSCVAFKDIDGRLRHGIENHCVKLEYPKPFCYVTFRIHPRYTSHIGFVLEDCRTFVHIMKGMRVGVERLDIDPWKKRISGFWELGKNGE